MFLIDEFIRIKPEKTKAKALLEARIGQGLFVTKWNGLNFCIIYFVSATYKEINVIKT